ncbi:hypothetical protein Hamer_G027207 [Homarus americanus]|uniref:Uncharacterized protein n=1 Tax=Homarus americanus TaxID=6706 RepID=A0A8J5KFL1_HOMAM|nr:hypothetical protein Hamer_G027207 [Homarus americanus]
MAAADEYSTTSHVLQLCLALQDRLEKVEKEVQSLKGENLALKLVLEEKKTFASVVKDGEVNSWKVVDASATKCTLKRHSAVDPNNRFSILSDECEEGASNTTSATPSVSVERGSSAVTMEKMGDFCGYPITSDLGHIRQKGLASIMGISDERGDSLHAKWQKKSFINPHSG